MNPTELSRLAEGLYGRGWQTRLAQTLGVNPSTVRRWVSGTVGVPPPVAVAITCLSTMRREYDFSQGRRNPYAARIHKMKSTDITILLDRSGSMNRIKSDVEGGFAAFLADQKLLPGVCRLTLVQFDSVGIDTVYEAQPVQEAPKLVLRPRGDTPLLDALGRTLATTAARLDGMVTRPERILFVIITDGQENASREYTKAQIKALVEREQAEQGWEFLYLGANVDAFAEAGALGVRAASSAGYSPTAGGVQAMYAAVSNSVSNARRGLSSDITEEDRRRLG